MSQRAAEMLKDDLEAKGPVKLSEVEAAQKEILAAARKLAEAGTISLGGKGEAVCLSARQPLGRCRDGRRADHQPARTAPTVGRRRSRTSRQSRAQELCQGLRARAGRGRRKSQAQLDELEARIARLDSIIGRCSRGRSNELDAEVEQQLTLLALTVGKQIVRRELRTDPAQVIAVIRESVARLPAAARDIRVHLHPEDAAVVREHLATPTSDRAWTIIEDPALTRGGCLVRTDTSQIDARLDSRLNAMVSAALGDERAPERAADARDGAAE